MQQFCGNLIFRILIRNQVEPWIRVQPRGRIVAVASMTLLFGGRVQGKHLVCIWKRCVGGSESLISCLKIYQTLAPDGSPGPCGPGDALRAIYQTPAPSGSPAPPDPANARPPGKLCWAGRCPSDKLFDCSSASIQSFCGVFDFPKVIFIKRGDASLD